MKGSVNIRMYIVYPKSGISNADKSRVSTAIGDAIAQNPELKKCTVIVRHSWRSRYENGKQIFKDKKSYAIQFFRRVKALHVDRIDPDTPEEEAWAVEEV